MGEVRVVNASPLITLAKVGHGGGGTDRGRIHRARCGALESDGGATEWPLPHFHVRNEDYHAFIEIELRELGEGQLLSLSPRVLGLVMEWGEMHQFELMENWTTLAKEGIFRRIARLV